MKFKKVNKRKLSTAQQIKRWFKPFSLLLALSIIGWNVYHYNPSELLKVSVNWTIDNTLLVDQKTLEEQIKPMVNKLHQLDLRNIKNELESHSWVKKVQVKRLFWDTIDINISTHKVATHWQNIACEKNQSNNNCQGYITTQGILITPSNLFYHQQNQTGSSAVELHSAYKPNESNLLFNDYLTYQQTLNKMKIRKFIRSNIDSLIINPNISVILGYNQQQQRLNNFIKIYAKLRKKISLNKLNKASYDMRYSKGFTLKY